MRPDMHGELTSIVILLGAALVVAWSMRVFNVPAILGFLLAGVAIGPAAFNVIHREEVEFFAELGLVLLLFTIGLELSPAPLLRMGKPLLVAAGLQIVGTTGLATILLQLFSDLSWSAAIIAGIGLSLSSTAIVLKTLSDRAETDTPIGALLTGILLVQDVVVILVLIFLPLGSGSESVWYVTVAKALAALVALVVVTYVARLVVPWIATLVARHGGQELMTLFAVFMALLGAWAADLADWSWPLGSCIAGLLLAQTDLRHQLRAEITPFRDVFNALFFMSIGMLVDIDLFMSYPVTLVGAILLTLAAKTVLTSSAILAGRLPLRLALTGGIALCTVSEFGYVLVKEANDLGLIPNDFADLFVAWAVGTMLLGALFIPTAGNAGMWLADRISRRTMQVASGASVASGAPESTPSDHVLMVGYGVNGRNLAQVLKATGIRYVVVDMNRGNVAVARENGAEAIVGDATRQMILERGGLAQARALVVAIADPEATRRIVAQAHTLRPDLYILARTRYVAELDGLYRLGARMVIPEEFETSIELFAHVLREFGIPTNVIEQQVGLIRGGRYGMLRGRAADRTLHAEWRQLMETTTTQVIMLLHGSSACGQTLREVDLRARTGVTIAAVTRNGKVQPSPSVDFRFEAGDVLVLVGTHQQLDHAKGMLAPKEDAVAIDPAPSERGGQE